MLSETNGTRRVLVVEDEKAISASVAAATKPALEPIVVDTLADARRFVSNANNLAGAVIDLMLPDGSGLDFVSELRGQYPVLPILILAGRAEPELINRAHVLHAEYVCKPGFHDNLKEFLRRVVQPDPSEEGRLAEAARIFASQHQLSVRETQILGLASSGVPRGHIADVLGVSENTIKTQFRSILDKTRQNSLSDVVWMVRQPQDGARAE